MPMMIRLRDERGAVAVISAIVISAVAISLSALVVDIGNAFARKRDIQTSVDLAALAGAAQLPDAATAIQAAFSYLQKNPVQGISFDAAMYTILTDGNLANGEISIAADNREITVSLQGASAVKVVTGFGAAIGFNSLSVPATATAAVRSPVGLLPFVLPLGCLPSTNNGAGSVFIKTGPGGGSNQSCGQTSTGDFGTMDSPRADNSSGQGALARNISTGIDHGIEAYPSPPPPTNTTQCNQGSYALAPAVLDNLSPTTTPANCAYIFSGNNVSGITNGLLTGGGATGGAAAYQGRLTGQSTKDCASLGIPDAPTSNRTSVAGTDIANDTLTCYLTPSATSLGSLGTATGALDSQIFDSPRFFYIPVIQSDVLPNSSSYYPIVKFVGAFLTSEVATDSQMYSSVLANNTATGENNGIGLQNATSIGTLRAFVFPLSALPNYATGSGNGTYFLGSGTKVVRLIK